MKKAIGPKAMILPLPAALIVTGNFDHANIVTIAWISPLTSSPQTVGFSMGTRKHSYNLLKDTGTFTVNIPSAEIMKEVDFCGINSGAEYDKFVQTGFTKVKSNHIDSPMIKECPINMECKLVNEIQVGNTPLFLGEVLETYVDGDKLTETGHFDVSKINPLVYCTTVREYWTLGEKIGEAYQVGKQLK